VVTFLRHVGCPFAEATMRELVPLAEAHAAVAVIAVGQAPAAAMHAWSRGFGGTGRIELHADEELRSYARWGIGRTGVCHFMGARALARLVELRRRGVRNRLSVGSRFQSGATFAVDARGLVVWRHLPRHAGDLPDLDAAIRAIRASG
jgi:hypothetical protein